MKKNKISESRQFKILEELYQNKKVTVNDLSAKFQVTPITIRRDLDIMAEQKLLERVHGGAMIGADSIKENLFQEKEHSNKDKKTRIARKAAEFIEEGSTIFFNSGTTTTEILKHISDKNVKIITNNVATANVKYSSNIELFFVGGEYRDSSKSLVGDIAVNSLQSVYSTCTFIGANGISVQGGITTTVQQEIAVNRLMIEHTNGLVILVADSTKLGKVSNFITASLTRVNILITDNEADTNIVQEIREADVEVILV